MSLVRDEILMAFVPSTRLFVNIYFFCTVYFNRMTLTGETLTAARLERESTAERDKTSKEIHDEIAEMDERNHIVKWYHRLWRTLPILSTWHIFMHKNATSWGCCRKDSLFHEQPWYYRVWHVFTRTLRICIRLVAIFITVIACGSAVQTKTALVKLPESFKISYGESSRSDFGHCPRQRTQYYLVFYFYIPQPTENQNFGAVCAFDKKFGNIREFASKDEAHLANYIIAHCGPCGACSTWNDFQVQYSTRVREYCSICSSFFLLFS